MTLSTASALIPGFNGYGITECSPLVSCNRNKYQKRDSVGCPIIDEELKILNPDENGEGEICVKGPNVMLGYYDDPEATAAAFDEEGFFPNSARFCKLDEEVLALYHRTIEEHHCAQQRQECLS